MLSFIAQLLGSHEVSAAPMFGQASEYHTQDIKWTVIVPIVAYLTARMRDVLVPSSFSRDPKN